MNFKFVHLFFVIILLVFDSHETGLEDIWGKSCWPAHVANCNGGGSKDVKVACLDCTEPTPFCGLTSCIIGFMCECRTLAPGVWVTAKISDLVSGTNELIHYDGRKTDTNSFISATPSDGEETSKTTLESVQSSTLPKETSVQASPIPTTLTTKPIENSTVVTEGPNEFSTGTIRVHTNSFANKTTLNQSVSPTLMVAKSNDSRSNVSTSTIKSVTISRNPKFLKTLENTNEILTVTSNSLTTVNPNEQNSSFLVNINWNLIAFISLLLFLILAFTVHHTFKYKREKLRVQAKSRSSRVNSNPSQSKDPFQVGFNPFLEPNFDDDSPIDDTYATVQYATNEYVPPLTFPTRGSVKKTDKLLSDKIGDVVIDECAV